MVITLHHANPQTSAATALESPDTNWFSMHNPSSYGLYIYKLVVVGQDKRLSNRKLEIKISPIVLHQGNMIKMFYHQWPIVANLAHCCAFKALLRCANQIMAAMLCMLSGKSHLSEYVFNGTM